MKTASRRRILRDGQKREPGREEQEQSKQRLEALPVLPFALGEQTERTYRGRLADGWGPGGRFSWEVIDGCIAEPLPPLGLSLPLSHLVIGRGRGAEAEKRLQRGPRRRYHAGPRSCGAGVRGKRDALQADGPGWVWGASPRERGLRG